MARRSLLGVLAATASIAFAAGLPLTPTAAAAQTRCRIENARTGQRYTTLQEAVNAATSGDTLNVWGVCVGDTKFSATGPAHVSVAGHGHAVLDGANDAAHPGPVVRLQGSFGGAPPYVTISNVTITGGYATGESSGGGGIEAVEANLTLDESIVTGNVGGGIGNGLSTTTVNDSRVVDNTSPSENGGGIRNEFGTVILNGSIVARNTSGLCGGGIYDRFGTVKVAGSRIDRNTASGNGGGVCAGEGGSVTLEGQSEVRQNSASGDGGGVFSRGSLSLEGAAKVVENTAGEHGGGIYNDEAHGGTLTFGSGWSGKVARNHPDNIVNG